jgi:ADP-ribosylglycohydrolase
MILNKCQKMLLGIAIGDSFGAGYEMQPRYKVSKYFTLEKYSRRHKWKIGKYTDDTQMSIAVTELLASGTEFSKINLANKFLECYRRDPHGGYARAMSGALKYSKNGLELLKARESGSPGNGAAMRAVPIGILPDLIKVIDYAKVNAQVTHNLPSSIASSVCVAAASHYFYHSLGAPQGVFDFCINACEGIDLESTEYFSSIKTMNHFDPELLFGRKDAQFGVPVNGMRTAGAVLYILSRFANSPKQTLIESVLLGGDTDSTACIALGISAINNGLNELPSFLLDQLEDGHYGKRYLVELGKKLCSAYT